MLPGFRFLFAAIALSISILVFSLGAAALLRAAHQEFASIPRLIAAEPLFAQRNEPEPALAILHADPVEANSAEFARADDTQIPEPSAPASSDQESSEPQKLAVSDDAALQVAALPDEPGPKLVDPAETMAEMPAPLEGDIATVESTVPVASAQPVSAAVEATAVTDHSTRIAMTRIATLGGPAVNIASPRKGKQRRTPKKHPAAAVKKPATEQQAVIRSKIRPKVAPRPRIARAVSRPAPTQSAAPFGGWDNRWPESGRAGKSAFGF